MLKGLIFDIKNEDYEKIPGIPEFVKDLYDQRLKVAVASSTLLKALDQLELSPEESIVISDWENGVKAAKEAGIPCIGYSNPGSEDQNLSDAIYLVEGFEEIDYDFIEKVYRRGKGLPWQIGETSRLILREMTLQDIDDIYKLYEDPSMMTYIENLYEDRDEELLFMRDYIHSMYGFYEYGLWLLVEKESGKVIGRAGLANRMINDQLEIELGYMIGVDYQRKGYAREACQEILKYAKEKLEFKKINCFIRKGNNPSIGFAEKLGFQFEEEVYLPSETLMKYRLQLVE